MTFEDIEDIWHTVTISSIPTIKITNLRLYIEDLFMEGTITSLERDVWSHRLVNCPGHERHVRPRMDSASLHSRCHYCGIVNFCACPCGNRCELPERGNLHGLEACETCQVKHKRFITGIYSHIRYWQAYTFCRRCGLLKGFSESFCQDCCLYSWDAKGTEMYVCMLCGTELFEWESKCYECNTYNLARIDDRLHRTTKTYARSSRRQYLDEVMSEYVSSKGRHANI